MALAYASLKMFECALADNCEEAAPGTHTTFPYEIAMEPVRLVFIWMAFALLSCGYARGGLEEMLALEQVRLDAADGSLDGNRDLPILRRRATTELNRESFSDARLQQAVADARQRHGAERRMGGILPYFLLYDVAAALVSCIIIGWQMYRQPTDSWIFWTSLYYMKAHGASSDPGACAAASNST